MKRVPSRSAVLICLLVICWLVCTMVESGSGGEPQDRHKSSPDSVPLPEIEPADWPTYNYDVRGSRHNIAEQHLSVDNVKNLRLKWQFPPKDSRRVVGAINGTPAVVNGYVYFGTSTFPSFYKLKPNGSVAWTYEFGGERRSRLQQIQAIAGLIPRNGILSSPLVTADSVYFGDVVGIAYCLDRRSGREKWRVNCKAQDFPGAHDANLLIASPIVAGQLIVFAGGAYEHAAAATPGYKCCNGRGFVMALDPGNGKIVWKYDVGPEPIEFRPPLKMQSAWGERTYYYGPSTSSVWSTPSYDSQSQSVLFGTDIHNSPRKPTEDDSRNYTVHSAAIISVDARTGAEKWVTQFTEGDVWNHTLPSYDPQTGYKDQSIGDTPKLYSIDIDGRDTRVAGTGSKNGGFYVTRIDNGDIVAHTPIYTGPPVEDPVVDPRTLALPSPIGGLQTGCATDGVAVYTNGIDNIFKGTNSEKIFGAPTGGRVTSISLDTRLENWRHERPRVDWVGGTREKPLFNDSGDPVASGIAIANGCLFFTTFTSNKLVVLNASNGDLLKEIYLGPVLAGPSVSRGRVYIGTGNTQFWEDDREAYYPKSRRGTLYCFGIPGEDEIDKLGAGNE